jgi:EXPERA (EXPanded EBP superfamily)
MITANHPLRYPLQAAVSLGQIYGDVLYYATSMFDHYHKNMTYCRPEAYYFWFYFVFMNFIWIAIPGGKTSSPFVSLLTTVGQHSSSKAFEQAHRRFRLCTRCPTLSSPMEMRENPAQTGI